MKKYHAYIAGLICLTLWAVLVVAFWCVIYVSSGSADFFSRCTCYAVFPAATLISTFLCTRWHHGMGWLFIPLSGLFAFLLQLFTIGVILWTHGHNWFQWMPVLLSIGCAAIGLVLGLLIPKKHKKT